MKIHAHSLRFLHKWIGLIIGLQFLLWTLSGTIMALLPMDQVAGGELRQPADVQVREAGSEQWARVQRQLGSSPVTGLTLRPLLNRHIYEVETTSGVKLFDAVSAERVQVDAALARRIANAAYPGAGQATDVQSLKRLTLAVREHELPIWQVDFADEVNSTYYVSASTGQLLERRNDSWRAWDFFWMLHNMDYVNRTSFNHPLIIMLGIAAVWLVSTGLWLLFRTGWRSDFKRTRRPVARKRG
jgi:Na+-transporting NADH:ubiquinone oxidoreductase subunit F